MSSQHIEIKRKHVMRLVALESAYLAAKRPDADALCDTVPVVEADDEILSTMWMKSCARLLAFLRMHLRRDDGFGMTGSYNVCSLHVRLCLACPDEGIRHVLATAMTSYLAKDILAAWLSMALPEREPSCRAEADQILLSTENFLTALRRPMRVRKRMEVV